MITACIHTQIRTVNVPCDNDRNKAIAALQQSVFDLTKEDGRCKFVVSEWGTEVYSWEYQPTFREDLEVKESKKVEAKEPESKYDWGLIYYILKKGKELDYDNLYRDEWDIPVEFDEEKDAHNFMKAKGYSKYEYNIVYEYSVWPKDEDWVCGFGRGLTKKEAREDLNKGLEYYHLKLLANGKVKEI